MPSPGLFRGFVLFVNSSNRIRHVSTVSPRMYNYIYNFNSWPQSYTYISTEKHVEKKSKMNVVNCISRKSGLVSFIPTFSLYRVSLKAPLVLQKSISKIKNKYETEGKNAGNFVLRQMFYSFPLKSVGNRMKYIRDKLVISVAYSATQFFDPPGESLWGFPHLILLFRRYRRKFGGVLGRLPLENIGVTRQSQNKEFSI